MNSEKLISNVRFESPHSSVHCVLRTKSMLLQKFLHKYFPVSRALFKIYVLTSDFAARIICKRCYRIAYFCLYNSIPGHHFYDYSYRRLKIKGIREDLIVRCPTQKLSLRAKVSPWHFRKALRPFLPRYHLQVFCHPTL